MGPLGAMTREKKAAKTALQVLPFPAEEGRWCSKGIATGQLSAKHTQASQWILCWWQFQSSVSSRNPQHLRQCLGTLLDLFIPRADSSFASGNEALFHTHLPDTHTLETVQDAEIQFWKGRGLPSGAHSPLWSPLQQEVVCSVSSLLSYLCLLPAYPDFSSNFCIFKLATLQKSWDNNTKNTYIPFT